jgi:hypothetical protein
MDDPNINAFEEVAVERELREVVELIDSFLSNTDNVAIFEEHAPKWTRDLKNWYWRNKHILGA